MTPPTDPARHRDARPAVRMIDINKRFGNVQANADVDL